MTKAWSATIARKKDGSFSIDIRSGAPARPADGIVIVEVIFSRDGESLDDFKERALRFVNEECG